MKLSEIFRLVWLNLSQNKFKVILTSIGIVVGSATIMMVLAIGTGGKEEVAEQFKNLNAGAIDISCEGSDSGSFGFVMGGGSGGEPAAPPGEVTSPLVCREAEALPLRAAILCREISAASALEKRAAPNRNL